MISGLLLLVGLLLLIGGGDALVRGASGLARSVGVSPLAIGLTVVAFGTSAPELVVNLTAALQGQSGLSFGNVIGSNLANVGLILGMSAAYRPMQIQGQIIVREIPMLILATALAVVMALDAELRDSAALFDRSDGICLLLIFCVFLYTTIGDVLKKRMDDPLVEQSRHFPTPPAPRRQLLRNGCLVVLGLGGLVAGGQITVASAADIARALGTPEAVIGLSLVALGTSLPELVTAIVAAYRHETDIAVGNVVGSNIFNLLFVLPTTAASVPVPVPAGGVLDLAVALALSLVLLPFCISGHRRLGRLEGVTLLTLYFGYSAWRFFHG